MKPETEYPYFATGRIVGGDETCLRQAVVIGPSIRQRVEGELSAIGQSGELYHFHPGARRVLPRGMWGATREFAVSLGVSS